MLKYFSKILGIAVLLWSCGGYAAEKNGVNIFAETRDLPQSPIIDARGISHKLSDFKGEFVLAVFWSRNCPPCIKELKSLNGFHKEVKNNGIHLVLISPAEEWTSNKEQKNFLKRFGAKDVDFYTDKKGKLASDFGIYTSPHTVLINKKGEEIGRIRGSAEWDDDKVIEYIYQLKAKYGFLSDMFERGNICLFGTSVRV